MDGDDRVVADNQRDGAPNRGIGHSALIRWVHHDSGHPYRIPLLHHLRFAAVVSAYLGSSGETPGKISNERRARITLEAAGATCGRPATGRRRTAPRG